MTIRPIHRDIEAPKQLLLTRVVVVVGKRLTNNNVIKCGLLYMI